jgi:hypothetical protein
VKADYVLIMNRLNVSLDYIPMNGHKYRPFDRVARRRARFSVALLRADDPQHGST